MILSHKLNFCTVVFWETSSQLNTRQAISLVGLNKGMFQRWIFPGFIEDSDVTSLHDIVEYYLPFTLNELHEGYCIRQFAGHNFSAQVDVKWNFRPLGWSYCLLNCLFKAVCTLFKWQLSTNIFQCKPMYCIFSFDLSRSLPPMRNRAHWIAYY